MSPDRNIGRIIRNTALSGVFGAVVACSTAQPEARPTPLPTTTAATPLPDNLPHVRATTGPMGLSQLRLPFGLNQPEEGSLFIAFKGNYLNRPGGRILPFQIKDKSFIMVRLDILYQTEFTRRVDINPRMVSAPNTQTLSSEPNLIRDLFEKNSTSEQSFSAGLIDPTDRHELTVSFSKKRIIESMFNRKIYRNDP